MLYSICIILRNWSGIMKCFKSSKKLICLICAMALLTGMCSVFAMATTGYPAFSATLGSIDVNVDVDRTPIYDTDISVMSFNLMHEVSSASTEYHYDTPINRINKFITILETYKPDIICLQEYSNKIWDNSTKTAVATEYDYPANLGPKILDLGYSVKTIYTAGFTSGLVEPEGLAIFYKTDRFTFGNTSADQGYAEYTNVSATVNFTLSTRNGDRLYNYKIAHDSYPAENRCGYHYVKLVDKEHNNQPFYVFNTKFSDNPTSAWGYKDTYTFDGKLTTGKTVSFLTKSQYGYTNLQYFDSNNVLHTAPVSEQLGRQMRTQQASQLKAKVDTFAKDYPVIIGGDFAAGLNDGVASDSSQLGLLTLYDNDEVITPADDPYYPADRMAVHQVDTDYFTAPDHIFVNSAMFDIADYRTITDSVGARRPSDHFPVLTQLSFRVPTDIRSDIKTKFSTDDKPDYTGHYDFTNGVYTDTVEGSTYPFVINISALNTTTQSGMSFSYKIKQYLPDGTSDYLSSNTATLSNTINKFDIEFYVKTSANSTATLYDTIPATIRYTGADKPILQAENVINHYFANNAYQIVVANDVQDIIIRPINGQLYSDAACTKAITGRFFNVQPGRNTYYIKATTTKDGVGDIYPVYIYKENKLALKDPKVLYIDDDFGDAVGTVAFWDGKDGISLVEMGTKGFDHFNDIVSIVNKADGYTVYVAPGNYEYMDSYWHQVNAPYTRNITLLGPNHDIEANYRDMEGTWQINPNRLPEAVIDGMIRFRPELESEDSGLETLKTASVTIKGFKFEGKTTNASISITDNRGVSTSTDTAIAGQQASIDLAKKGYGVEMNIENNIFSASGYHFNASAISANNGAIKTGVIANNYFKSRAARIVNEKSPSETQDEVNDYYRAIFLRNPKGLVIDGNRFVDIGTPIWMTSEIHDQVSELSYTGTNIGNLSYTMQDNRFENCGSAYIWATALGSTSEANIKYINNGFIRCGSAAEGPAVDINLTEHYIKNSSYFTSSTTNSGKAGTWKTATTDYSKLNITIHGNNFMDCYQSIRLFRLASERILEPTKESYLFAMHGNMRAMSLKINENRFLNPTEATTQTEQLKKAINFNFFLSPLVPGQTPAYGVDYTTDTGTIRTLNTASNYTDTTSRWSLTHNYFQSAYLTKGTSAAQGANTQTVTDANAPAHYITNYITVVNPATHTYRYDGVSFRKASNDDWQTLFAPYYTNYALTTLSDGTTAKTMQVTATGYNGVYDGKPHGITVTPSVSGAIVSYSIDKDETRSQLMAYNAHNFMYTDVTNRPITVHYKVEMKGYNTVYGSATVNITPATHGDLIVDETYPYVYGTERTLTLNPESTDIEDHYRFFYNNTEYTEIPKFTNVGRYNIKVIVTNPNYEDKEDDATLIITQADLSTYGAAITGDCNKEYNPDNVTKETLILPTDLPRDVVVEYSVNGGEWTIEKPEYTYPTDGVQTVKIRMGGTPNYLYWEGERSFNITPAYIEDVSVTSVVETENGDPLDLLTVKTGREGTTVKYAVEGKEYTDTKPTFLKPGTYTVSVWFTRQYHYDRVITHNVKVNTKTITNNFDLGFKQSLVQNHEFKDKLDMTFNEGFENYVNTKLKDEHYTLTYTLSMWPTDTFAKTIDSTDFKMVEFGVKYAATRNDMEDYKFYQKHGKTTEASKLEVATHKFQNTVTASGETGMTGLYRYNRFHIYNTKPLKARYAMMYLKYTISGVTYEEYGPIYGTSTLLSDHSGTEEGNDTHGFVTSDGTISLENITGGVDTKYDENKHKESVIFLQSSAN